MVHSSDWADAAALLTGVLDLSTPPIAITFWNKDERARGSGGGPGNAGGHGVEVAAYEGPFPPPTADGRTGRVSAGCVFWSKAAERTFSTVAADHGNCSVGSLTHGFATLAEVADRGDVAALVESGWVGVDTFGDIPAVEERPQAVIYGPLAETPIDPDVVLVKLNAKQLMVLHDAWPGLRIDGKPQCHIVAVAKQHGEVAVSVGCMLSRTRTAMRNTDMTCAIPAARLREVLDRLSAAVATDALVADYAAADARRFVPLA